MEVTLRMDFSKNASVHVHCLFRIKSRCFHSRRCIIREINARNKALVQIFVFHFKSIFWNYRVILNQLSNESFLQSYDSRIVFIVRQHASFERCLVRTSWMNRHTARILFKYSCISKINLKPITCLYVINLTNS